MSPFADEELQGFSSLWWLVMLFGVAVLGVGVFFVASPHETLTTFTVIAGIFLLVDGVVAIVASIFRRGEGRGMLALIGVLSAVAGLVLIKKPFDTLLVFVLIFGVWLIVAGVVRFVAALGEPEGRAGNIAIAIFDFVAGVVILSCARSQPGHARGDNRHRADLPRRPLDRRRLGAARARPRSGQRAQGATGNLTAEPGRCRCL